MPRDQTPVFVFSPRHHAALQEQVHNLQRSEQKLSELAWMAQGHGLPWPEPFAGGPMTICLTQSSQACVL